MRIVNLFLIAASIATLTSCSSMDRMSSEERDYYSVVKDFSDRAEFNSGFMNVFQMQGTVLNSQVMAGQVAVKNQSFGWNDTQKTEEQNKIDASLRSQTVIFLSFYTPENKLNNLDSPSSIWRVFLDVNNKRYVGAVSTYVGFANEAQLFYPYHSVFAKAYLVKFPVPIANIQDYELKLTVTGTIGSDTLKFHPLKVN